MRRQSCFGMPFSPPPPLRSATPGQTATAPASETRLSTVSSAESRARPSRGFGAGRGVQRRFLAPTKAPEMRTLARERIGGNRGHDGFQNLGAHQAIGHVDIAHAATKQQFDHHTRAARQNLARRVLLAPDANAEKRVVALALVPEFAEMFGTHFVVAVALKTHSASSTATL